MSNQSACNLGVYEVTKTFVQKKKEVTKTRVKYSESIPRHARNSNPDRILFS